MRRRRQALAAVVLVALLLAALGIREWREHPAIDLAASLEDMTGVVSARALEWPELTKRYDDGTEQEDDETVLPIRVIADPKVKLSDLEAVLRRSQELTRDRKPERLGGITVPVVAIQVGAARARVGSWAHEPNDDQLRRMARDLRALAGLPAGNAVIEPEELWVAPGDMAPLTMAHAALDRLRSTGSSSTSLRVGDFWEQENAEVWLTGNPNVLYRALSELKPLSSRLIQTRIFSGGRMPDQVILTTGPVQPAQQGGDLRRAQQAAGALRSPKVVVRSAGLEISGTDDPDPALKVVEAVRSKGYAVTSISTDRKKVELTPITSNEQIGTLAATVGAMRPSLPGKAELVLDRADEEYQPLFTGTVQELVRIGKGARPLERDGYEVSWTDELVQDDPGVAVELRPGEEWSPRTVQEAMRRLRTVAWSGIAHVRLSSQSGYGEDFGFRSTQTGQAEPPKSSADQDEDLGGISRAELERLWNETAT